MVKVSTIMKKLVVTGEPNLTLADAAKIMTKNRVGSIVVVEKSKPVRMVTNEDIIGVIAKGQSVRNTKIRDLPRKEFVYASPDDSINNVTKIMIKKGIKRIPIMKEGKLLGIVSEKEIVLVSPQMLNLLSEKLRMRVDSAYPREGTLSGICEQCEQYSYELRKSPDNRWLCEDCREELAQ